jgi:hypothetical protein
LTLKHLIDHFIAVFSKVQNPEILRFLWLDKEFRGSAEFLASWSGKLVLIYYWTSCISAKTLTNIAMVVMQPAPLCALTKLFDPGTLF